MSFLAGDNKKFSACTPVRLSPDEGGQGIDNLLSFPGQTVQRRKVFSDSPYFFCSSKSRPSSGGHHNEFRLIDTLQHAIASPHHPNFRTCAIPRYTPLGPDRKRAAKIFHRLAVEPLFHEEGARRKLASKDLRFLSSTSRHCCLDNS